MARSESCLLIALHIALLLACGPQRLGAEEPMTEQQRVKLRSGEYLEGRVFDLRGGSLEINQSPGRVQILKRDVEQWVPVPRSTEFEGQTVVLLKNGRAVGGKVTRTGSEWRIDLEVGTTHYDNDEVIRVVHPDGTCSDGAFTPRTGFYERVEAAIAKVMSDDPRSRTEGLEYLTAAGYFVIESLEMAMDKMDTKKRLHPILVREQFRVCLPDGVEQDYPDLVKIITEGKEADRLDALRDIFLDRGEAVFPLLVVLVLDPDQPTTVRSLAVDVLQRANRIGDLLDAYNRSQGATQVAIAVALGDGGIFIGIPTLLEALDMESPEIRGLAASRLADFTGEDYDYDPNGTEAERQTATSRWKAWWRENRDKIEETLAYQLRPGEAARNPRRARATQIWREAIRLRDNGETGASRELFVRATEEDPTYLPPLITLGIFYYQIDGDYERAIDCFRRALRRANIPGDEDVLRIAYFHLGKIYQRGFDYEVATKSYLKAIELAPLYWDAWFNLGVCYYDDALRMRNASREARRERFEASARSFANGKKGLEEYRMGLVVVTHDQMSGGGELPFSRREYNMSLLKLRKRLSNLEARFAYRLALSKMALGQMDEALEAAREAIKSPDPRADHHLLMARILDELGRTGEAGEERRKAAALGPPDVSN